MKACVLVSRPPSNPIPCASWELPKPQPAAGQVLVRVHASGCAAPTPRGRGRARSGKSPIVPGTRWGIVEENGIHAARFQPGREWGFPGCTDLRSVEYCRAARENLCERAVFTGDGGWRLRRVHRGPRGFVYALPEGSATSTWRRCYAPELSVRTLALRRRTRGRLAISVSAPPRMSHQVARHWTSALRHVPDPRHRKLALDLGAVWPAIDDEPPEKLDAAMICPPASWYPGAAGASSRGTVAIGGIHMTPSAARLRPAYHARVIRSVANNTRQDGEASWHSSRNPHPHRGARVRARRSQPGVNASRTTPSRRRLCGFDVH